MVPLPLVGLLKLLEPLGGSWRLLARGKPESPWPQGQKTLGLGPLFGGPLGRGLWPGRPLAWDPLAWGALGYGSGGRHWNGEPLARNPLVWGALGRGPLARGEKPSWGALPPIALSSDSKPLARRLLGPAGGPWPWEALGAGWPWGPLVRGGWSGPWPGAPGPGGPLARGALGPGGPWPGGPLARGPWPAGKVRKVRKNPKITKLSNQPAWTPSPASWSRNPATRGQGARGRGCRQTLNPKP